MDKNFLAVEDRMVQLRSEVGTNIKALNYDINGLLHFKNNSRKSFWYFCLFFAHFVEKFVPSQYTS